MNRDLKKKKTNIISRPFTRKPAELSELTWKFQKIYWLGTFGGPVGFSYVTFSEGLFLWRDVQAIGKQIRISS